MFKDTLAHIQESLLRYEPYARMSQMLTRTPSYALHWYALLVTGLLLTIVTVAIAGFQFTRVGVATSDAIEQQVAATTINRQELKDVLEQYRTQASEAKQLQTSVPRIIDPGR